MDTQIEMRDLHGTISEAHLGLFGGEITLEQEFRHHNIRTITLTACGWAGGTCASFPDFCDNHQFHVILLCLLLLILCTLFLRISDSQFTWILDLKE